MKTGWRGMEPAEREAHFNPRIAVPDADTYLQQAAESAAVARDRLAGSSHFQIRYGVGPKQTLDVLKSSHHRAPAPVVMFFHGGYWRALDKDDHTHLAIPFVDAGVLFLNVNYDLCPDVTLSAIAAEIRASLLWASEHVADYGGNPNELFLYGHSAGAHLSAMLMAETYSESVLRPDQVRGIFAISGIYEPEVARTMPVNAEIGLDAAEAASNDVLQRAPKHAWRTLVAAGDAEPDGWVEQSRAFEAHLRTHRVPVELTLVPGCNHFTFLEVLSDSGHPLVKEMLLRVHA